MCLNLYDSTTATFPFFSALVGVRGGVQDRKPLIEEIPQVPDSLMDAISAQIDGLSINNDDDEDLMKEGY